MERNEVLLRGRSLRDSRTNSAMNAGTLQLLITFPDYRHAKIYLGTRRQRPLRSCHEGALLGRLTCHGIRQVADVNTYRGEDCSLSSIRGCLIVTFKHMLENQVT